MTRLLQFGNVSFISFYISENQIEIKGLTIYCCLDLGSDVSLINAYLPSNNTLIGYSSASKFYMVSNDFGDSWIFAHYVIYKKYILQPGMIFDTTLLMDDTNKTEDVNYSVRDWTCRFPNELFITIYISILLRDNI